MTIIQTETIIKKWDGISIGFTGKYKFGERPGFKLLPYHPTLKHGLIISADFHFTNPDTLFLLDVEIETVIFFEIDRLKPTQHDLYSIYASVRNNDWRMTILKTSMTKELVIEIPQIPMPEEQIHPLLLHAIQNAYPEN